ncbi:MAG: hypothetical protein KI788_20785 [Mameliella sp.]|nr:hypothetical protein [Mameliella sp.]
MMRGWQFITPAGHRSKAYPSRSEAVIEAVRFMVVQLFARLGVIAEPERLSPQEAEETFRELEPEGWKIEGVR